MAIRNGLPQNRDQKLGFGVSSQHSFCYTGTHPEFVLLREIIARVSHTHRQTVYARFLPPLIRGQIGLRRERPPRLDEIHRSEWPGRADPAQFPLPAQRGLDKGGSGKHRLGLREFLKRKTQLHVLPVARFQV